MNRAGLGKGWPFETGEGLVGEPVSPWSIELRREGGVEVGEGRRLKACPPKTPACVVPTALAEILSVKDISGRKLFYVHYIDCELQAGVKWGCRVVLEASSIPS